MFILVIIGMIWWIMLLIEVRGVEEEVEVG